MAGQQHKFERTFPVTPDELFAAFREAVEHGHYKVIRVDEFAKAIEFKTHYPFRFNPVKAMREINKTTFRTEGQVMRHEHGARIELVATIVSFTGGKQEADDMGALLADISARAAKAAAV